LLKFVTYDESALMKLIKAIVRPTKVDVVKAALVNLDIVGMTITNVRGFGRQKGQVERYRGTEIKVDFLPKVKIEVVVNDDKLAAAVEVIQQASQTGEIGDGKIFVLPVEEAVRIRTGESGSLAL
jgi:nitrogen regulatory protein PII